MSTSESANRAERYDLSSIEVKVGDQTCGLVNVSSTGILVSGWTDPPAVGDEVECRLIVPVFDRRAPLVIEGRAVRVDERGVAVDYATPAATWPKLLGILDRREKEAWKT